MVRVIWLHWGNIVAFFPAQRKESVAAHRVVGLCLCVTDSWIQICCCWAWRFTEHQLGTSFVTNAMLQNAASNNVSIRYESPRKTTRVEQYLRLKFSGSPFGNSKITNHPGRLRCAPMKVERRRAGSTKPPTGMLLKNSI